MASQRPPLGPAGRDHDRVAGGSNPWPTLLAVLAAAGGLAGWALWPRSSGRSREPEAAVVEGPVATPSDRWSPRERNTPAPGCAPRASRRCIDGDAWWIDACDVPQEVAEPCGLRLCKGGACEPEPREGCGDVTALGRCAHDVAEMCQVDALVRVDCRAQGRTCAMTGEGPVCREPSPDACDEQPPRCEGDVLWQCRDGRIARFDCQALAGRCLAAEAGRPARCAFSRPTGESCGACGCAPEPTAERCDGRDNDANGVIDDGVECGVVPIVAFVVGGGEASYGDDDIQTEITETNEWFAREDGLGLAFELREIVRIEESAWLELDGEDLSAVLASSALRASPEFFVPVVYTDVVLVEGVSRPGLAIVPNGWCGGVRRIWERQPTLGLVALAKRRWPTTLAHELGHYLGLCHTHEAPDPIERVAASGDVGEAPSCDDTCDGGPDGICDTPLDPGPEECDVDDECVIHCRTGDRADPGNMMAYYPPCRVGFSNEQAARMREALALRRGWHRCLDQACECDPKQPVLPAGEEDDAQGRCPEQMTCRAFDAPEAGADAVAWRCDLDGAAVPGGRCHDGSECGSGSICVTLPSGDGWCARTCDEATPPRADAARCTCRGITTPAVSVCREDLRSRASG